MPKEKEHVSQHGSWTLTTKGVVLWLRCVSIDCEWSFSVYGMPFPPPLAPTDPPTPIAYEAFVLCPSCRLDTIREASPEWVKRAAEVLANGKSRPHDNKPQARKAVELEE